MFKFQHLLLQSLGSMMIMSILLASISTTMAMRGLQQQQQLQQQKKVEVGDIICVNGYVMDYFCIRRGKLFDNPSISTLGPNGPTAHSVHCLIDVPQCVNSPFEILYDVSDGKGETYGRAWRVDNNDLLVAHARKVGECDQDCTGDQKNGLNASIIAKVIDLGTSRTPSLIEVKRVGKGEWGCGDMNFEVPNMIL